jgi:hypothetical protein
LLQRGADGFQQDFVEQHRQQHRRHVAATIGLQLQILNATTRSMLPLSTLRANAPILSIAEEAIE